MFTKILSEIIRIVVISPPNRQFILRVTQYIFIGCVITLVTQTMYTYAEIPGFHDMLEVDQIDQKAHYGIMMDFIENGFADYYKTGKKDYFTNSAIKKGYHLMSSMIDEIYKHEGKNFHELVRVSVGGRKGGYMTSELFCIYQQEYKSNIYEYWVLKQWTYGRIGKNYNKYCEFIITESHSLMGQRAVIEKSTEFIVEHVIDDDFTVVFPKKKFSSIMHSHNYIACPKCCENICDPKKLRKCQY